MPKLTSPEQQLASFIDKFTPQIASMANDVLAKMRALYPTALELVYDNYNALAIGFSPTERPSDAIFSIAVYPKWVSLLFLQGASLPDPKGLLQGTGTVAKHIVLASPGSLDDKDIVSLMTKATKAAKVPFAKGSQHRLIIKSISAKQRPRRPTANAS